MSCVFVLRSTWRAALRLAAVSMLLAAPGCGRGSDSAAPEPSPPAGAPATAPPRFVLLGSPFSAARERVRVMLEGASAADGQEAAVLAVDPDEDPEAAAYWLAWAAVLGGGEELPAWIERDAEGRPLRARSGSRAEFPLALLDAASPAGTAERDGARVRERLALLPPGPPPPPDSVQRGVLALLAEEDPEHGGFGLGRKSPDAAAIRLLLAWHRSSGDAAARDAALRALEAIVRGGVRDFAGGGFFGPDSSPDWMPPPFEKDLAANAEIVLALLDARAGDPVPRADFEVAIREAIGFILRELKRPDPLFERGIAGFAPDPQLSPSETWHWTWSARELEDTVGPELMRFVVPAWGTTTRGNLSGRNLLRQPRPLARIAVEQRMDPLDLEHRLDEARALLLDERAGRPQPSHDPRALLGANALLVSALARAGAAMGEPSWLAMARGEALRLLAAFRPNRAGAPPWSGWSRIHPDSPPDGLASPPTRGSATASDLVLLQSALLDLYEISGETAYVRDCVAIDEWLRTWHARRAELPGDLRLLGLLEPPADPAAKPSEPDAAPPLRRQRWRDNGPPGRPPGSALWVEVQLRLAAARSGEPAAAARHVAAARSTLEAASLLLRQAPETAPTLLRGLLRLQSGLTEALPPQTESR